jgi:hypothetical protein
MDILSDILLMYLAPIHGLRATTGYTGVALLAPLLNIVSCQEPAVLLSDLIQGLTDTQVTSDDSPCSSICMSFTLLQGRTIWAILDHLSVDSQWCSSMPFLAARDFHWAQ